MDIMGWIGAIVLGGIAGWIAEQIMKTEHGLLMNIVMGIAGALVANVILMFFNIPQGGWIWQLIVAVIGACLLIWIWRAITGRRSAV